MPSGTHVRLPLLLTDDVQFPCTRVRLPLAGALLCDLLVRPPEERWLGVVLARQPGAAPAGTASRLLELEPDGEGARVVLLGAHRFALAEAPAEAARQTPSSPTASYPTAWVRLLPEPPLDEHAPLLRSLREELADRLEEAVQALGEAMTLPRETLQKLVDAPFEELVNRAAAALDVPPLRKVELLTLPLPDRAAEVAGILRSRTKLVELLRPYRHLMVAAEHN
jgi:Lon protease-like protein